MKGWGKMLSLFYLFFADCVILTNTPYYSTSLALVVATREKYICRVIPMSVLWSELSPAAPASF